MNDPGTREFARTPEPGTVVPCPLRAHQPIAMGRCVEYQRDNGCHCEHALVALRRTEKHLLEPRNLQSQYDMTAQADALDGVRALIERVEQIEKARPAPVPKPPPAPMPAKEISVGSNAMTQGRICACRTCKCAKPIADASTTGVCWRCQQAVHPGPRKNGVAPPAQQAPRPRPPFLSEPQKPAPQPAKESSSMSRAHKPDPCESCGGPVDSRAPGQQCGACRSKPKKAALAPKTAAAPKLPRKPRVNNVRVLPPAKQAAHVPTAPPIFKGLPPVDSLPPEYLIACARYLYELRKRIEFALAGEAFHVEQRAQPQV